MGKLIASIQKELLLLFRDKTGLLLLFIMPAFLVLVITLIQENVLKTDIKVLFMDNDNNEIGQSIETLFKTSQEVELIKNTNKAIITEADANKAVAEGSYQFCIIIPKGITAAVKKKSLENVNNILFETDTKTPILMPQISLYFDPTIQGSFRVAISNTLNSAVKRIEQQLKLNYIFELLPKKINMAFPQELKQFFPEDTVLLSLDRLEQDTGEIIGIKEIFATKMGFKKQPTSVQQNIPAWTLFGIFFIVVPIAGSLISERESGTMLRLKSMPVSYLIIMTGKIAAYTLICFGQFGFILFIGKFILPLFGSPAFEAGPQHGAFFLILLSSISAATGYGILLGTLMKTYEQASMFGPVSVVIAAVMGGIMVPVYTMPEFIQPLSMFSPLAWGQNAFYDILLRGGGITSVLPEICYLFTFFLINLGAAYLFIFYKNQSSQ